MSEGISASEPLDHPDWIDMLIEDSDGFADLSKDELVAVAARLYNQQCEVACEIAFVTLRDAAAKDPDPVSMFTEGDEQQHGCSVVVLRGQQVIEMFRQWAERNGILHRDRDVDGEAREEVPR